MMILPKTASVASWTLFSTVTVKRKDKNTGKPKSSKNKKSNCFKIWKRNNFSLIKHRTKRNRLSTTSKPVIWRMPKNPKRIKLLKKSGNKKMPRSSKKARVKLISLTLSRIKNEESAWRVPKRHPSLCKVTESLKRQVTFFVIFRP